MRAALDPDGHSRMSPRVMGSGLMGQGLWPGTKALGLGV